MELGSGFSGGLLEAGDPRDVVCVGGVGGRSGDVCFGGGGGTLVFGGEGVGVAGRILVGFGVAFGELVVGLEVGVFDFVFADVDLEFVFVDVDLEVVDFLLEAAGVAFIQQIVTSTESVLWGMSNSGIPFSLDNFRSPTRGAGRRKSSITLWH